MQMLSTIANICGIISFVVSILTFIVTKTILKDVALTRTQYEHERFQLQTSLMALRDNILEDNQPLNLKYRSQIRTILYTYRQKYLPISSLSCLYHLMRATHFCKKINPSQNEREKLCLSLDFLIARFNKTEVTNNER